MREAVDGICQIRCARCVESHLSKMDLTFLSRHSLDSKGIRSRISTLISPVIIRVMRTNIRKLFLVTGRRIVPERLERLPIRRHLDM